MKNVLIPTDFSLRSLDMISQTAETLSSEKLNIILFHVFNMPTDILDLMFLGKESYAADLITEPFRKECRKVKQQYSYNISSISFKHFYGNNMAVFNNFLEANKIDLIVCPDDTVISRPHKQSADPIKLIHKSSLPVIKQFRVASRNVASFRKIISTETVAV